MLIEISLLEQFASKTLNLRYQLLEDKRNTFVNKMKANKLNQDEGKVFESFDIFLLACPSLFFQRCILLCCRMKH